MKYCQRCGKELMDQAVMCPHCGCAAGTNAAVSANGDAPNAGLLVLGLFFPLIGLIVYLVMKADKPLAAKSAGKGALIGCLISAVLVVLYVLIFVVLLAGVGAAVGGALG